MKLDGKTNQEIGGTVGLNTQTVRRWMQKLRDAGHVIPKDKTGRKKDEIDLTKLD